MNIVSQYRIQKKYFEAEHTELLKHMYNELIDYWNNYPLMYHNKKSISYDDFVRYCFSISSIKKI
jgi:hypothetical protein